MARPRSEDKQAALLKAATDAIAAHGLGASTSSIAKLAGVAEGTLFRYFATKDVLVASTFEYLIDQLEASLRVNYPPEAPIECRTRCMWYNYIDWGVANPAAYSTINQLVVSGKLSAVQLERATTLCSDIDLRPELVAFPGLSLTQSSEFMDSILTAIANTTVSLVSSNSDLAAAYKEAGFEIMWATITRAKKC